LGSLNKYRLADLDCRSTC